MLPQLYTSLDQLIREVIYTGVAEAKVADVFPKDFPADLRAGLAKIIAKNLSDWRETAMSNMVSPPKLVDFGARRCFLAALGQCLNTRCPCITQTGALIRKRRRITCRA